MLENVGGSGSGGIMAGMIFAISWVPIMLLQWRGGGWRERKSVESAQDGQAKVPAPRQ